MFFLLWFFSSPQLDEIIQIYWAEQCRFQPTFASSVGVHDYDHLLANLSADSQKRHQEQLQNFLQQLRGLGQLQGQDEISRQLLITEIYNETKEYEFQTYLMPLTAEGGFHSSLVFLPRGTQIKSEKDAKNYLLRLQAVPNFFDQNTYWMKKGISLGFTQPQVVLKGFEYTIESQIVNPDQSPFFAPFNTLPSHWTPQQKDLWQARGKKVIAESVVPSYKKFLDFFVNEYRPSSRTSLGCSELPRGREMYAFQLKKFVTKAMDPEKVHEIGLSEVARIRKEMQEVIEQTGFEGTFAEFLHFLRTDSQFYAQTPKQLLMEAAYIAKKADGQLPKFFGHLPRLPYTVEPVPDAIAPKYTAGRYVPGGQGRPGTYWVNTYALEKRPLYALEALTLHEAVPGHHLQMAISLELEIPKFRRNLYHSGFGEGWALYCEYLGQDMGFYTDPYQNFGRLTYEMWRACRLVVDTGIHVKGWSREQAMAFMKENTALSLHEIETETDRYISWPGQALSYKLGELTIRALRKELEEKLGESFNLADFHDTILENGSVTLDLLEKQIRQKFLK